MHLLNQKEYNSKVYFTTDNGKRVRKSIASHPFNRTLIVTHPTSIALDLSSVTTNHYYLPSLPLSAFLEGEFYAASHDGRLTGLSKSRIDSQDSFCIHKGIMRLSLMKDTYQRAGLVGEKSRMSPGKFNVTIDFTVKGFSGSKAFQRIKTSFTTVLTQVMEIYISLPSESPAPSVLQADWRKSERSSFTASRMVPSYEEIQHVTAKTADEGLSFELLQERQEDTLNHLALLAIPESVVPSDLDPYITTYACPEPCTRQDVTTTKLTGFFGSEDVSRLVDLIAEYPGHGWIVLQVIGFAHTPVAWIGSEHGFTGAGENTITLLSTTPSSRQGPVETGSMDVDGQEEMTGEEHRTYVMWEVVGARDTYS